MLTKKDYCDYETSIALEELGYPLPSFLPKALLYEAQKWLREEKGIEIVVLSKGMIGSPYYYQVYTEDYVVDDNEEYSFYEEALSEGVCKAIEILKILKEG